MQSSAYYSSVVTIVFNIYQGVISLRKWLLAGQLSIKLQ